LPVVDEIADLERRASAGEAGAQLALAARLLAFPDSPESFARGAALAEAAARSGHPDAAATMATIEAVGAGRERSWARALDWLQAGAESGSDHARAQLRLLAGEGGAAQDWRGLRGRIDPDRLLQVPARAALSDRPRLRVFQGFASEAECRWVMAQMRPRLAPAVVWDSAGGLGRVDEVRNNSSVELRLTEMDVVTALLRARISAATGLPEAIFELPQVMHYRVGEEFRPHHDFLDPSLAGHAAELASRGQRIGTFLIYLNDDFEGGATEFPRAGLVHRGRAGDALFFANVTPDGQPDPLTEHAGRPPTSGEKWILSQWIRGRPPGPAPTAS
jgi:TPR repeat protein